MRVAHVSTSPVVGSIGEIVGRFPVLARFPEAQAGLGHEVALFCRSDRESRLERGALSLVGVEARDRMGAVMRLAREVEAFQPQAIHLNGIIPNNGLLAARLRERLPKAVIAIHDQVIRWEHTRALARVALRAGLPLCDLAFFSARALAQPLIAAGVLRAEQIAELPGGSCTFAGIDRAEARRRTGLAGDPLYLWVGRLAEVKNPLLAARALAQVLAGRPSARVALAYGDDQLLSTIKELLGPTDRVSWLGRVAYEEMEAVYSSADIIVSTSWREGYSFAVVEAMACGVTPVVSAIPASLQAIGALGRSFTPGDEEGLVAALRGSLEPRDRVRAHFEAKLSYPAMAAQSIVAYSAVLRG